jgi:hypothetical protein
MARPEVNGRHRVWGAEVHQSLEDVIASTQILGTL